MISRTRRSFMMNGCRAGTVTDSSAPSSSVSDTATSPSFASLPKAAKAQLAEEGEKLVRFIEPDAGTWAVTFEAA